MKLKLIPCFSCLFLLLAPGVKISYSTAGQSSEDVVFPADAGVLDVSKAPFNAKGDGVADDTAAIQQALETEPGTNKIIYLPRGTYLVSNQLRWAPATQAATGLPLPLSLAGTTARLKDGAGIERAAPLFFVSPTQLNLLVPAGAAEGAATMTIVSGAVSAEDADDPRQPEPADRFELQDFTKSRLLQRGLTDVEIS
jgi:Pectate lyase superfamily protein